MTTALDNGAVRRQRAVPDRLLDGLRRVDRRTRISRQHRRRHRPARPHLEAHVLRAVRQQGGVPDRAAAQKQRRLDRAHPGGGRSRGRLAGADPPGRRRLRRPHRSRPGDHAELDPRGARARRGGTAAAPARHGTLTDMLVDLSDSPGFRRAATAADLAAAGADPAGRIAGTDRAVRRGRARRPRHHRARRRRRRRRCSSVGSRSAQHQPRGLLQPAAMSAYDA